MPPISPEKYVERYGEVARHFPGMSKTKMLKAISSQIAKILAEEAEPKPTNYRTTDKVYIDEGKKTINELGTWKANVSI